MKLKKLLFVMVCLMGSTVFGASLTIIGSGNWTDSAIWNAGTMPTVDGADEVKQNVDDVTVVINSNVGTYNNLKIDLARGNTLSFQTGGYMFNNKEIRPGDAGMWGSGTDIGYINQTGGTLELGSLAKVMVGYKTGGNGTYTISGGSLIGAGRLFIGCSNQSGSTGTFKVVGNAATINLTNYLYIGRDSSGTATTTGTGNLEFNVQNGLVSKLQVLASSIDASNEAAAIANLIINSTGTAPTANIVLVENTGSTAVAGAFDNAAEGAIFNVGGVNMTLTYKYAAGSDSVGNDIALIVPEPITLALLGLGFLAVRRK
jgi:hypothetical protein